MTPIYDFLYGARLREDILKALKDPAASARKVAWLITQDPEIEGRVLRLANADRYGRPGRVTDVAQAVLLIGFERLAEHLRSAAPSEALAG